MKNEKLLLFILAAVQFSHILDFMIIMPLGSQIMRVFEISPQQFSFIVSAYALSAFFVGLVSSVFIDRFDRKTVLLVAFVGFTIGTFTCAFSPTYSIFLISRSVTGAFGGVLGSIILAIVGDSVPPEKRGSAMGLIMTAFSVASVVGVPLGLFLAATYGWQTPFILVGAIGVIFTTMTALYVPSFRRHLELGNVERQPIKVLTNIFTDSNQVLALLFTLVLMLGHFTIIPFIAPYMTLNVGFSEVEISYIYLVGGIFTMIFSPIFGKLSDRIGHQKLFAIMGIIATIPIFLITNMPPVAVPIALVATVFFFIAATGRSVPSTAMVTLVVSANKRGSFMSMRSSVNELSLALASFISGLIVTKDPTNGQLLHYNVAGYVTIAMSLLAVWIGWKLKAVPENLPTSKQVVEADDPLDAELMTVNN